MLDYGDVVGFDSLKVKGVMFEFGINYLLDHPRNILKYGYEYFVKKCERPKTRLVYDSSGQVEEEETESAGTPYSGYADTDIINIVVNTTPTLNCLSPEAREMVKKLARRRAVEKDDVIIYQGDSFDYFYLIESGTYGVYMISNENEEPVKVHTYVNNGCFGELAIMYLRPRAATIIAKTNGYLWKIDQPVFVCYIKKPLRQHRNILGKFFENFKCFNYLSPYKMIMLVDKTEIRTVEKGDFVYREGFLPGYLFFIISGSTICCIYDDEILNAVFTVKRYEQNDHFGEAELYTDEMRQTSMIAREDTVLAAILFDTFLSLPESAHNYFKKSFPDYENTVSEVLKNVKAQQDEFKASKYYCPVRQSY